MFYQPKEKHAPRIVIAVVFGLAFFLAWGSLYLHLIGYADASYADAFVWRIVLVLSYLGVMVFAVFLARLIVPLRIGITIPFLALSIVGVFFGGYSFLVPEISLLLGIVGAMLVGIENGWLLLLWSEFFGYVDSRCAGFSFAVAFITAALLYWGASMLPHLAQVIIAATLPAASTLVIFFGAKALKSNGGADSSHRRHKISGMSVRYPWRTSKLFGLLKRSFATTAIFALIFAVTVMHFGHLNREVASFGILGAALLVAFMLFAKHMTMKRLYRVTQPLMGLGLALLPVDAGIGMTIIGCAYSMILYLLMLTMCEVANRFETSVVRLAGFAFGVNLFACVVGMLIGLAMNGPYLYSLVDSSALSIVLLVVFMTYIAQVGDDGGFIIEFSTVTVPSSAKVESRQGEPHISETYQPTDDRVGDMFDPRNMAASVVVFHEAVNQRCELVAERFALSAREEEVLDLIMQGHSLQETADKLFISTGTVKTHINHIYKKTGTQNRTELKSLVYSE